MEVSGSEQALRLFRATFGSAAVGCWSAPGRVNLIGEHTDYNGGPALPIALDQRTTAAASPRDDDLIRVVSEVDPRDVAIASIAEPKRCGGWSRYVTGVGWALRAQGYRVRGLDVAIASDVPVGAGLSSSAALECAAGAAWSDLFALGLLDSTTGRRVLAAAGVRAENDVVGAPTGGMDQAVAMLAQAGRAVLVDSGPGTTALVPFAPEADGLAVLVVDTRTPHALVDGQYAERRRTCEQAARLVGVTTLAEVPVTELPHALTRLPDDLSRARVRHVVTECDRVERFVEAVHQRDWGAAGALMTASHRSLRDDYEVSCDQLDAVVDTALEHGALGARMTGGGFGGSAIVLVEHDLLGALRQAVRTAFGSRGWAAPDTILARAGDGARRDH